MSELSSSGRNQLPDHDFAYINPQGQRHLPIPDAAHVRNATAGFGQTTSHSAAARRAAAVRIQRAARACGVTLAPEDDVVIATRYRPVPVDRPR